MTAYAIRIPNGRTENHNRLEIISEPRYAHRCKLQPANDNGRWLVKWRWNAIAGPDAFDFKPCSHQPNADCEHCPLVEKHMQPGGLLHFTEDDIHTKLTGIMENLHRLNPDRMSGSGRDAYEKVCRDVLELLERTSKPTSA